MAGTSGAGSSLNRGVFVQSSTLTGGTSFDIKGTSAGTTGTGNSGVYMAYSTLSDTGTVTGTGGGTGRPNYGVYMQGITTGLDPANVTGTANDPEDEEFGNFFPAILPLLMAEADRRASRKTREEKLADDQSRDNLKSLFARIREFGGLDDLCDDQTLVFRIIDGHITLDPEAVSSAELDATLAALGIQSPATPLGSHRVVLIYGEDTATLSGFFAFVGEDGVLSASQPIENDLESIPSTVADLITSLGGDGTHIADEVPRWSAPEAPFEAKGTRSLSEAFGLI